MLSNDELLMGLPPVDTGLTESGAGSEPAAAVAGVGKAAGGSDRSVLVAWLALVALLVLAHVVTLKLQQ